MKKKMILTSLTGVAIIAPVATVVACNGETKNTLNYKANQNIIKGDSSSSMNGLKKEEEGTLQKFKTDFSTYIKAASFAMYKKEVKDSIKLQKGDFQYKIFLKKLDKKEISKKINELNDAIKQAGTDDKKKKPLEDQKKKKQDESTKLDKDIDKINELIKKLDNNTAKGSDFPLLLEDLKTIKIDKEKEFKDEKRNYQKSFQSKPAAQGSSWVEHRSKKYNGAKTDDEAIDFLVYQETKSQSMKFFSFKINDSYTVKQFVWAMMTKNPSWDFLSKEDKTITKWIHVSKEVRTKLTQSILSAPNAIKFDWDTIKDILDKKVYFISSEGKNLIPFSESASTYKEGNFVKLANKLKHIIKVQHGILPFIQGKNPFEPWTIKEDQLHNMLRYYGTKPGFEYYLDKDLFTNEKLTDMALQTVGMSDGSSSKQGSLGYMPLLEYVKSMYPGFAFGILYGIEGPTPTELSMKTLSKQLNDELKKLLTDEKLYLNWATISTTEKNHRITELFTRRKSDITKIFGAIIRDFFPKASVPTTGGHYVYKEEGHDIDLVFSKAGIHFVKINTATNGSGNINISTEVKKDLDEMADKGQVSSSTNIIGLIGNQFNDDYEKLYEILNNNVLKGVKADLSSKIKELHNSDKNISIDNLTKYITALKESNKKTLVQDAINSGSKPSWLETQINSRLKDPKMTLDEIYKLAKKGVA